MTVAGLAVAREHANCGDLVTYGLGLWGIVRGANERGERMCWGKTAVFLMDVLPGSGEYRLSRVELRGRPSPTRQRRYTIQGKQEREKAKVDCPESNRRRRRERHTRGIPLGHITTDLYTNQPGEVLKLASYT